MPRLFRSLVEAISEPFRHLAPAVSVYQQTLPHIERVTPARTLTISLTDHECRQKCAHCNGHYLKGMQPFSKLDGVNLNSYDAVLISGGSTSSGEVPIRQHVDAILSLPPHLKLNLHTGYQSAASLLPLKQKNPVVSFDLPVCDEVVKEVYGLTYSRDDFRRLYLEYARHFRTVAHVTLGLAPAGKAAEEMATVKFLAESGASEVVFLVFRPTPGTRMCNVAPPALERVMPVLAEARRLFADRVQIGCMRPAGIYRRNFDILAWLHGYRRFVMPDHKLLQILEENGVSSTCKSNCCALEA